MVADLTDSPTVIAAEAIALSLLLLVLELSAKKHLAASVKGQEKLLRKSVKKVYSPFSFNCFLDFSTRIMLYCRQR